MKVRVLYLPAWYLYSYHTIQPYKPAAQGHSDFFSLARKASFSTKLYRSVGDSFMMSSSQQEGTPWAASSAHAARSGGLRANRAPRR